MWKSKFIRQCAALMGLMALVSWSKVEYPKEQLIAYCQQFNQIQIDVREQNVSPDSAARAFQDVMRNIRSTLMAFDSCTQYSQTRFVYPLRGYLPKYSVGGRGRGYRTKGFDLFDVEARGSHPAHDLFIRDGNQDNLDDHMCAPVDLLSMSRGIVLATDTTWQPGSELRGGNYIWVYDPCLNGLFYYAHNSRVVVEPGQLVQAGQKLGEVGRTGYNAWKERSPTHVHMMYLKVNNDYLPEPANPLPWLWEAEVRKW
jgi:peptidoglycan LD-endopeptidase LytH